MKKKVLAIALQLLYVYHNFYRYLPTADAALTNRPTPHTKGHTRRQLLVSVPLLTQQIVNPTQSATAAVVIPSPSSDTNNPPPQKPSSSSNSLASKLSQRDPSLLRNAIFNIPPRAQTYPPFMRGEWQIDVRFRGYLFPSTTIPKSKLLTDATIPGFQKCSIAAFSDVGRELTTYRMRITKEGLNDGNFNAKQTIEAHLGDDNAVKDVAYDAGKPNRMTINFVPYRTRNAERIELFCNARESELVTNGDRSIFVCSEYFRQVTFSLSQEFGVARQVVGNYAHFWTWREGDDGRVMSGNVLTACYLDPQSAMFFDEPSKPVAVYSHDLVARRVELSS